MSRVRHVRACSLLLITAFFLFTLGARDQKWKNGVLEAYFWWDKLLTLAPHWNCLTVVAGDVPPETLSTYLTDHPVERCLEDLFLRFCVPSNYFRCAPCSRLFREAAGLKDHVMHCFALTQLVRAPPLNEFGLKVKPSGDRFSGRIPQLSQKKIKKRSVRQLLFPTRTWL